MNSGVETSIRIIIVDDHPLYRQGLKQVLAEDSRFELIAEADTGSSAVALISKYVPTLAVLDLNLPDLSGFQVAERLHELGCTTRIVVLTMHKEEQAFNQAINLGIQGYVLKENAVSEIVNCLLAVASGTAYVSPALSGFLLNRHRRATELNEHTPGLASLTLAEKRILKRIAQKQSTKEIAIDLGISPRTVESHRARICDKLHLKGNNSLLQFALENSALLRELA